MMRRFKELLLAALLVVTLLVISSFATVSATKQTDEPPVAPTTASSDELPSMFEEDLGPATRDIPADTDAIIRAALAAFSHRAAAIPAVTVADAAPGNTIPPAAQPVYLPLVLGPPPLPVVVPPGATPAPEPPPPASVTAVLWPEPSIRAGRGATIAYEFRVYNDGRGDAGRTTITLPYNRNHVLPIGSRLDRSEGDWVSELTSSRLTVTFGKLGNGKMRSGIVYFQVNSGLPDNTVIDMRPEFTWSDERSGGSGRGNWAPVLVGGGNDTAAFVWLIVDPASAPASVSRTFFSDRFVPGEHVVTWLNTPGGVVGLPVANAADPSGRVWLTYRPDGLARGTYQLVAHGTRSRLTGVVSFVVR